MAVRQYIGARYVPTYYQNSQDPTSAEWEPNVNYDPLTIVSLPNMHSYQSKKFVPASVESPASNPEYWYDQGYASAYYQALQDQIDDMNDGSVPGSLQDQINDNASDITALTNKVGLVYTLEDFGAVGDGITDDTQALIDAYDTCRTNGGGTIICAQHYRFTGTHTLGQNTGTYYPINIIVLGGWKVEGSLRFTGLHCARLTLVLEGGGNGTLNTAAVILEKLQSCTCDLKAKNVNSTAFNVIEGQWNTMYIDGRDNMRTLYHGDPNITSATAHAFGTYVSIHDSSHDYPSRIENSNDITILHFEGFFNHMGRNMFEIVNSDMVNFASYAQGGHGDYALLVDHSAVNISYCFLLSEEGDHVTNGIHATNGTRLSIDEIKCGNMASMLYVDALNVTGRDAYIYINKFNFFSGDYNRTRAHSADANAKLYRVYINGANYATTDPTGVHADITNNYISCSFVGHNLVLNGQFEAGANIAAYSTLFNVPVELVSTFNYSLIPLDGSPTIPIYNEGATIKNRVALTSGKTYLLYIELPIRDYTR